MCADLDILNKEIAQLNLKRLNLLKKRDESILEEVLSLSWVKNTEFKFVIDTLPYGQFGYRLNFQHTLVSRLGDSNGFLKLLGDNKDCYQNLNLYTKPVFKYEGCHISTANFELFKAFVTTNNIKIDTYLIKKEIEVYSFLGTL